MEEREIIEGLNVFAQVHIDFAFSVLLFSVLKLFRSKDAY